MNMRFSDLLNFSLNKTGYVFFSIFEKNPKKARYSTLHAFYTNTKNYHFPRSTNQNKNMFKINKIKPPK